MSSNKLNNKIFPFKAAILILITAVFLIIFVLYENSHHITLIPSWTVRNKSNLHKLDFSFQKNVLTINPSCSIPDLDPFDKSVMHLIGPPNTFKCMQFPSILSQRGNILAINWTVVNATKLQDLLSYCALTNITRPVTPHSDNFVYYESSPMTSTHFFDQTEVVDEFVHVRCFSKRNKLIYENYYSFVIEKMEVEKTCTEKYKTYTAKKGSDFPLLNVMVIGLDSVSRLNSIRFMPKVRQFLLEQQAIEMVGYNKVGDNTIHNIVPFLTGKYLHELPWSRSARQVFDNYRFLWNNFSEKGYRTLFLEDYPEGAIFDYLKPGFHKTPTDYYDRHFHLSFNRKDTLWYNEKNCFVDRSQTEIVLDYTAEFMKKFHDRPYFGFVFITRLTHDILERTVVADENYLKFFQEVFQKDVINNTILVFMGDHGMRFGPIRSSYIGKMEERLPMLFIYLPPWFKTKYSKMAKNLAQNARKLSTPFDMFETLNNLLSRDTAEDFQHDVTGLTRAYSLFDNTPLMRDCQSASINSHWCTCSKFTKISNSDTRITEAAGFLVAKINKMLHSNIHLCHEVSLESVLTVYNITSYNKAFRMKSDNYQMSIMVSPGGGVFEATVHYEKNLFVLNGDISRINAYGHQKRCNVDYKLEKYCFCK